jgi:hypothetical protein
MQNFILPTGSLRLNTAIKTNVANALESLRTQFSGAAAPSNPIAGQLWLDTSTSPPMLKQRDDTNSVWYERGFVGSDLRHQLVADGLTGSLSATTTAYAGSARGPGKVKRLVLLSDTASTSSSGNEWQVGLSKCPAASPGSPVELFSGTVGTFTALGGVGGGAEFVADAAYVLTPDQNLSLADLDVLKVTMTKVGTATTLTNFRAVVEVV